MPLGRGSLNVVYKARGKKRDQKMVQPGTEEMDEEMHKMPGGHMMKDSEMGKKMKKMRKKMK